MTDETQTAIALAMFIGIVVVVVWAGRKAWRDDVRRDAAAPPDGPVVLVPERADAPRCLCGAIATMASPRLQRGRGSGLRDLAAAAPMYHRVVDKDAPPSLCAAHAHLADTMLAAYWEQERAELMQVYANTEARVALFQTEELPRRIHMSLSKTQQAAGRKVATPALLEILRAEGGPRALTRGTADEGT